MVLKQTMGAAKTREEAPPLQPDGGALIWGQGARAVEAMLQV
jgi:hypothetical protein